MSHDLHHVAMQLGGVNLQQHGLRLALRHQRKLKILADFAGLFLSIRGRDIPEVVAGVEPGDFHGGSPDRRFLHGFCKHRGGADPQPIGYGILDGLPFESKRGGLGVFHDDRREVQRCYEFGRSQHV